MISKAEPCLVVSIQNQLTLCIATMIVRQIQVAQNFYSHLASRWLLYALLPYENQVKLSVGYFSL